MREPSPTTWAISASSTTSWGASRIGVPKIQSGTVLTKSLLRKRFDSRLALQPYLRASSHQLQSAATHRRRLRERSPYEQREAAAAVVALPASWTSVSVNSFTAAFP